MSARRTLIAAALLSGAAALTACASTTQGSAVGESPAPTTRFVPTDTTEPETPPDTPANIPTELAPVPKRPTPLPATVDCAYPAEKRTEPAKPAQAPPTTGVSAQGTVIATIKLSIGDVTATLDRALAPCTVNSFVSLAKQSYYDETSCHRLTTAGILVLQCGDPSGTGSGGPGYTFDDEVFPEIKYGRGILAMANAGKNPETQKGTNGSQFFIVYGEAELPPSYTVFGSIDADSMEVVDDIARAGTISQGNPGDGKPQAEAAITAVTTE